MTIDSIKNGIVIDHIKAGNAMEIYKFLCLDQLDSTVAIIKNVPSEKTGKKDIIKIDKLIDLNLDVLGYIDPNITVNIIKNSKIEEKCHLSLPSKVVNVIKCKNPRCITSCEQEIDHIFVLSDTNEHTYRCVYCETEAEKYN